MRRAILVCALALVCVAGVPAASAASLPSPTGYVNDNAQVLSPGARASLEAELAAFEKETSTEIAVVTVPSMDGDYIEHYAVQLFEAWGIGKNDRDNGILLLLAIEERKLRIEVGYGLEGALPDALAQRILDTEMTPLLKQGDYDGAVTAGVRAIAEATKGEYVAHEPLHDLSGSEASYLAFFIFYVLVRIAARVLAPTRSWWLGGIIGAFFGIFIWGMLGLTLVSGAGFTVVVLLFGLMLDFIVSSGHAYATARGVTPPWWAGGSGGRGGGGGFSGFGGGSSGGGGASGGW